MFEKKLNIPVSLTYDDVLLEPAESYVEPSEADIRSRFSKNIQLTIPICSSAMDTVTESMMAITLAREGGIGVLHRNLSAEAEVEMVRIVKRAEDLIERHVLFVNPQSTIIAVERLMNEHGIGGAPVVEDGRLVGIVSRRDIRAIVGRRGEEPVEKVMTRDPFTVGEDVTPEQALELMYAKKVERLPVLNKKGDLLGIITMQDLLEKRQFPRSNRDEHGKLRVAAAVGPFDFERAMALDEAGADALVIDCAHAHNMKVVKSVKEIKESAKADCIAGNIATGKAASEFVDVVDGIKVGIGPGSICTTRVVAGVGLPQISAIASVADVMHEADVPVIADGGIRFSGDVAKAIAAGADCVMLGSMLAGTDASPGRIIVIKGRRYKQYRGMGSLGVMTGGQSSDRYFQSKGIGATKFVPEGVEGAIPYSGEVSDVIYQLIGGLKSAMGYTGSQTLQDLKTKSSFVRITAAGIKESHPHDIVITDEAPNYRLS
ncbi:MAG: IMP dehydrogenase [Methanocalculus sp. MSAO_Arc1]|uniref:IMP dehydrogenase n=1 Tax=Methanocalculus TaxID=71151 RepID=UPI000FF7A29E|nr:MULTISPECIES: IMP dehydrogenase [unclassified Methanocalculus]MCP1663138.1 IMP dehydrogenase [Methanocalculus sp. AMF5]RQD79347.1 MAG: IMP dehydrogenase [Methanocalculus sp. MSAO_Arc1]